MNFLEYCIVPDWPAPAQVKALQTTRLGGVSQAPYAQLNLGDHVGDHPLIVAQNRQRLSALLPAEPVWLQQVHGTAVANADEGSCFIQADASVARQRGAVCAVMTADCLPILLCDQSGTVVAAAHAGWKGLAAGVIETTVQSMRVEPVQLMAWLGPAISQRAFEVGAEVREQFMQHAPQVEQAFIAGANGKWMADIYLLARQRLNALGISQIYGGNFCTYSDAERFYSFRREGVTGRMGTFVWIE
ncbi:MAG: peptidoglycan editing factor PgeF [Gallionellaceae bacterium]|jgi:hypothetical protein